MAEGFFKFRLGLKAVNRMDFPSKFCLLKVALKNYILMDSLQEKFVEYLIIIRFTTLCCTLLLVVCP